MNVEYFFHTHRVVKKCIGGGVEEGDSPQINVPFQSPASFSIPGNRSKLMKSVWSVKVGRPPVS